MRQVVLIELYHNGRAQSMIGRLQITAGTVILPVTQRAQAEANVLATMVSVAPYTKGNIPQIELNLLKIRFANAI
jgi:hypothetical protein